MTELAVGTQVRTKREATFTLADDSIVVIETGSLGTVEPYPLGGRWTVHASVNFSTLGGGFYFLPDDLVIVEAPSDAPPTLEQQLADAIARAERAERERDALKAFVEALADRGVKTRPDMRDYQRTASSMAVTFSAWSVDVERFEVAESAREVLKAIEEKAVGDE